MRYKIWDKQEDISFIRKGKYRKARFTAAEFIEEILPWAGETGNKLVVSATGVNGSFITPLPLMVDSWKRAGAPITDDMTDEEILAAIEEFEDNPPVAGEPSVEEQTLAALQLIAMNGMEDVE
jgi:hypothetical protein